jgi:hypothetical protein
VTGPDERRGEGRDDALRARLRAADPAASLPPAERSRTARLLEDTMASTTEHDLAGESREAGTHGRGPLTWLVAAAAVAVIAGVGLFGVLRHDGAASGPPGAGRPQPSVTTLSAPAAQPTRCMVPDARTLGRQELAFDGTVRSISGRVVTLVPSRFYTGAETDLVEVEAPPADLQALVGAVDLRRGGRYLVSATDGRLTVCGFSGPYSADLAALYEEAFPA